MSAVTKAPERPYMYFMNCDSLQEELESFRKRCEEHQFLLCRLGIAENSIEEDVYEILTHILKLTDCKELVLQQCRITKTRLRGLLQGCRNQDIQLQKLIIFDRAMPSDAYSDVAAVIKATECNYVQFGDCNLSKEKLKCFGDSCKEDQVSVSTLVIMERMMTSEVYCDLGDIVSSIGCSTVFFAYCDLTKQKLECFGTTGKQKQISLSVLKIKDAELTADVYREIAFTLKSIDCKEIIFEDCALTREKLSEFYAGCKCNDLSVSILRISDAKMLAPDYREIAFRLKSAGCKEILFKDCCLTREKLSEFYTGCKDNNISISKLSIVEEMMTSVLYRDVASIIRITGCKTVWLGNCDLAKQMLEGLDNTDKENQTSFSLRQIKVAETPTKANREIEDEVPPISCQEILFEDCNLTREKLSEFYTGSKDNNLSIPILTIDWSHSTATDDDVLALCDLMMFVVEKLVLYNWEIDADRTQRLKATLRLESSKALCLHLPDGEKFVKSPPDGTMRESTV